MARCVVNSCLIAGFLLKAFQTKDTAKAKRRQPRAAVQRSAGVQEEAAERAARKARMVESDRGGCPVAAERRKAAAKVAATKLKESPTLRFSEFDARGVSGLRRPAPLEITCDV